MKRFQFFDRRPAGDLRYCGRCRAPELQIARRFEAFKCGSCSFQNDRVPAALRWPPLMIALVLGLALPIALQLFGGWFEDDPEFAKHWLIFFAGGMAFAYMTEIRCRAMGQRL